MRELKKKEEKKTHERTTNIKHMENESPIYSND